MSEWWPIFPWLAWFFLNGFAMAVARDRHLHIAQFMWLVLGGGAVYLLEAT